MTCSAIGPEPSPCEQEAEGPLWHHAGAALSAPAVGRLSSHNLDRVAQCLRWKVVVVDQPA
ncbi:MAG: hypothetical protein AAB037_04410, partial [Chloroflexota bacterium]